MSFASLLCPFRPTTALPSTSQHQGASLKQSSTSAAIRHCQSGQWQVALDTETNGDDPHASTLFTLQLFVPGLTPIVADLRTVLKDQTRQLLVDYLRSAEKLVKQFQNGKFDLKMLGAIGIPVPPPYFDTMLVSQILVCGQQEGSKLGDLSSALSGRHARQAASDLIPGTAS